MKTISLVKGILIPNQNALDSKTLVKSELVLKDLGINNNLAYTYYDGLRVLCQQEKTEWIWKEAIGAEVGLLATNFIYTVGTVGADGVDYSLKSYNFFKPYELTKKVDKEAGKSLIADTKIIKLDNLDNTKDIDKPLSTAQKTYVDATVDAQITDSTALSDPTIPIVAIGNVHILGVGPGTYPNWGGMVIPANNTGTLRRVEGVYSVSLALIDLSFKTDIVDTNILKGNNFIDGGYINATNGAYVVNAGFKATPFLLVDKTKDIVFTAESTNEFLNAISFYDKSYTYISGISDNQGVIAEQILLKANIPALAVYFRLCAAVGLTTTLKYLDINSNLVKVQNTFDYNDALNEYNAISIVRNSKGKNLLNPNDPDIILGQYINGLDTTGALGGYAISGLVPIKDLASIAINFTLAGAYIRFSDIYKKPISVTGTGTVFTVPVNAAYVEISGPYSGGNISLWQVEIGVASTTYEPYVADVDLLTMRNDIADLDLNKISKEIGKNLFDKNALDIVDDYYLASTFIGSNNTYFISGYMPVLPSTTYTSKSTGGGPVTLNFYTSNKIEISSVPDTSGEGRTFTTPINAAYVRVCGLKTSKNVMQVELGSSYTSYEEYTTTAFFSPTNELPRAVEVILPKKLYFIKGKQSCIYHENVLFKNLNDPTTLSLDKGINYNRQTTFNFDASTTNQTLGTQIVRNFKLGNSKNIQYDVIDPIVNNGKVVNALFVGDSFSDIGSYIKECKALLVAQGVTFNLLGTCGDSTFKAEGLAGGTLTNTFLNTSSGVSRIVNVTGVTTFPTTGYPGRNYQDANGNIWQPRGGKIDGSGNGKLIVTKYGAVNGDFTTFPSSGVLTKIPEIWGGMGDGDATISYNTPVPAYFNPFINPSTGLLDLTNYITYWGFANPNVVVFQFTWNDLQNWANDGTLAAFVANCKLAADHVHSTYSSADVIFSLEPYGSMNGNWEWNGKKYTVLRVMELMLIQFEDDVAYNTWVKIAASYAFVDLVNGYSGGATVVPCERYPLITEVSGGDGVHPNTGMLQIADCIAPIISAVI